MLMLLAYTLMAYLLGSLSSAVIVCRLLGLRDPRSGGSGNPGATNVLRLHGRIPAALTLLGDVLKGFVPVVVALAAGTAATVQACAAIAAVLGHLFPVFFGFKGGKGVATFIGVLFGMGWTLGLAHVLTWFAVARLFRYSSLAALCAAPAPFLVAVLLNYPLPIRLATALLAAVVITTHRGNIARLLAGAEGRIGEAKPGPEQPPKG